MCLGGLEREIKELAAVDPATFDDAELSELVVELAKLRTRLEATEVALVSAWDTRRVWAGEGARSGAAWLARETREPKPACRPATTAPPRPWQPTRPRSSTGPNS